MQIDRRRFLTTATCALLTGVARPVWPQPLGLDTPAGRWHPLTRSLLDRVRCVGTRRETTDVSAIEQVIGRLAESTGRDRPLVIKWMETPTDAFDHLSRLGLDALLDMGTASFWRGSQLSASRDVAASERAFEARMMANELLGVDEHDRTLMAPRLLAKSKAMAANPSDEGVFRVRAVSSQIGWLETSMADVAAQAVKCRRRARHPGMRARWVEHNLAHGEQQLWPLQSVAWRLDCHKSETSDLLSPDDGFTSRQGTPADDHDAARLRPKGENGMRAHSWRKISKAMGYPERWLRQERSSRTKFASAAGASSAPCHQPAHGATAGGGAQQRGGARIGRLWLSDSDACGAAAGAATRPREPHQGHRFQPVRYPAALGRGLCPHQGGARPLAMGRYVRPALRCRSP
jgi:hypothetical protein